MAAKTVIKMRRLELKSVDADNIQCFSGNLDSGEASICSSAVGQETQSQLANPVHDVLTVHRGHSSLTTSSFVHASNLVVENFSRTNSNQAPQSRRQSQPHNQSRSIPHSRDHSQFIRKVSSDVYSSDKDDNATISSNHLTLNHRDSSNIAIKNLEYEEKDLNTVDSEVFSIDNINSVDLEIDQELAVDQGFTQRVGKSVMDEVENEEENEENEFSNDEGLQGWFPIRPTSFHKHESQNDKDSIYDNDR